jgi:2-phospho-L-lactate transferase/gluconeogenesis factor (CofD/UPF0052 family)
MTEPGETDGLTLAEHLEALAVHGGSGLVDGVVVHGRAFEGDVLARYAAAGAVPVALDRDQVAARGVWVVEADVAGPSELARHDPEKLGRVLARVIRHGGPTWLRGLARLGGTPG